MAKENGMGTVRLIAGPKPRRPRVKTAPAATVEEGAKFDQGYVIGRLQALIDRCMTNGQAIVAFKGIELAAKITMGARLAGAGIDSQQPSTVVERPESEEHFWKLVALTQIEPSKLEDVLRKQEDDEDEIEAS